MVKTSVKRSTLHASNYL